MLGKDKTETDRVRALKDKDAWRRKQRSLVDQEIEYPAVLNSQEEVPVPVEEVIVPDPPSRVNSNQKFKRAVQEYIKKIPSSSRKSVVDKDVVSTLSVVISMPFFRFSSTSITGRQKKRKVNEGKRSRFSDSWRS